MLKSINLIPIITLLCLLGFWACENEDNPVDPYLVNSIRIAESPIFMHDSLAIKPFQLTTLRQIKDSIHLLIGNDTLRKKTIEIPQQPSYCIIEVNVPYQRSDDNLSVNLSYKNQKIEVHTTEIINYQTSDTIDFVAFTYINPRPVIILKRECWPDYTGSRIGPDYDFTISSRATYKDIIKGDSITRTLHLEKVRLVDGDKRKTIEIEAPLDFSYTDKNWLNLLPTEVNVINSPTDELTYGLYSDDGGYPDFMLIGEVIGHKMKLVSKSAYTNDTLERSGLILPDDFQIGLDCAYPGEKIRFRKESSELASFHFIEVY